MCYMDFEIDTRSLPIREANHCFSPRIAAINFDGTATWSPANFRKTVDLTKMLGKSTVDNAKLDKLIEESAKTPCTSAVCLLVFSLCVFPQRPSHFVSNTHFYPLRP